MYVFLFVVEFCKRGSLEMCIEINIGVFIGSGECVVYVKFNLI